MGLSASWRVTVANRTPRRAFAASALVLGAHIGHTLDVTLRVIGYWSNEQHPELPAANAFVDMTWNEDERHIVSMYFARGTIARTFMGLSICRICGAKNGSVEYTDGVYAWPEGFAHYIDEHRLRPPSDIVSHALAMSEKFERANFDLSFCVGQSGALQ
jgi:hypothetical protein